MIPGKSTAGSLSRGGHDHFLKLRGMTPSPTRPLSGIPLRLQQEPIAHVSPIYRQDYSQLEIREYHPARSRRFTHTSIQEWVSPWISSGTEKPVFVVAM